MTKRILSIVLMVTFVFSALSHLTIQSNTGVDHKAAYFQNGEAVNLSIKLAYRTRVRIIADALKIEIASTNDPQLHLELDDNVDTSIYKVLALKVKKTYAPAIEVGGPYEGQIFYNEKGQSAKGDKQVKFAYAEGTDYQWVYVTLPATQVGFIRFDMFKDAPSIDDSLTLAYVGFFKSVDDMNTFANSQEGKSIGNNAFLFGDDYSAGIWLDHRRSDATKPGYYWIRFNATSTFSAVDLFLYAKTGEGCWKIYNYDTDYETSITKEPVTTGEIYMEKDGAFGIALDNPIPAGQYIFYVEQYIEQSVEGSYLNIGTSKIAEFDPSIIEFGYNGYRYNEDASIYIYASFKTNTSPDGFLGKLYPGSLINYRGSQIRMNLVSTKTGEDTYNDKDMRQGLRFSFDLLDVGESIEVWGGDYIVTNQGALVILKDKLDEVGLDNMVVENVSAIDKLAHQTDLVNWQVGDVTYKTAYVYNIPEGQKGREISARGYIECRRVSDGEIIYIYSPLITDSVESVYERMPRENQNRLDERARNWFL